MKRRERQIGRRELRPAQPARPATVTIQHQPRAFTLIELLVVIGVIALLMAILLPCLQRARRQAKAMVCQAHLKQWAHILAIYTDENEGYFPYGDSVASVWLFRGPMPLEEGDSMIRPFTQPVSTDGIRCCPMAVREPVDTGSTTIGLGCGPKGEFFEVTWAHATKRSEVWKTIRPAPSFVASYGFNGWLLENTNIRPIGLIHGRRELPRATNVFSVRGRSAVPVLLDCLEPDELVDNGNSPPEKEGVVGGPRRSENIALFCVNRHDGYLRGLFLDWSVRKVGIKELWTLKWHRDFNTRGQWTKAAGVQPEDWPEWMRNFKDY